MSELLAPVGNIESLKAAIYAGADAVYLGLGRFNARQKADGFNKDNIKESIDLCHLHGVKVYITFNTLVKDREFKDFEEDVKVCANANADAFIVTDIGTLDIFKKYNVSLHASTQMGIHNYEGAKIAKELGFSRVVLSREALIEDIRKIKTLGIEIEYFVHGALCVSFSGGCLLSSFLSGDSGNRGLCKQSCRLKYQSSLSKEEKYYLSTSDQCLIEKLNELIDAGVYSLKIEGRLKSAAYVGEVVNQYRRFLDNKKSNDYMSWLRKAYNRGSFTKGYNYDDTLKLMSPNVQGNQGEAIGKIVKYSSKTLYIKTNRGLFINDGLKIFKNGVELGGFRVDNIKKENDLYLVNTIKTYPVGSDVYLTADEELRIKYDNPNLDLPISIKYKLNLNEPLYIEAKYKDINVEFAGDIVSESNNRPLLGSDVKEKLSQINGTGFYLDCIDGNVAENIFYPVSKLKEAKRIVLDNLKNKILSEYNSSKEDTLNIKKLDIKNDLKINNLLVEVGWLDLKANAQNYIELSKNNKFTLLAKIPDNLPKINDDIIKNQLNCNYLEKYLLKLPKICRGKDNLVLRKFIELNKDYILGFVCENIYGIDFAREYNLPYILGTGMNIYNSKVNEYLSSQNYVFSLELSKNDFSHNGYTYSFGKPLMMSLSHCPIKLNLKSTCADCRYNKFFTYKLNNNVFEIERFKLSYCYFEMNKSTFIDLRDILNEINNPIYIDLNAINDFSEKKAIIEDYINKTGNSYSESTKGHYNLIVK